MCLIEEVLKYQIDHTIGIHTVCTYNICNVKASILLSMHHLRSTYNLITSIDRSLVLDAYFVYITNLPS